METELTGSALIPASFSPTVTDATLAPALRVEHLIKVREQEGRNERRRVGEYMRGIKGSERDIIGPE